MSVRVSGKQMEVGEAFRQKIEDQIEEAVTKYFDGGYSSQVTVEKAGGGFEAEEPMSFLWCLSFARGRAGNPCGPQ